ncbi:MAG: methyltransferase [Proteobacteria bacterium]|nr:methyltransferase [Pseudomonadota bacterium]
MEERPSVGETVDEILGGRLRIIQKKDGYRFSIDSLLLAHFACVHEDDSLIDLGTGSGIVAMILARRRRCRRIVGIDIQEELVAMAKRSVVLNGLEGRVEIRRGDIRRPESLCAPGAFDAAVFNPPYRRLRSGRMNPDPEKAVARHEIEGAVGYFLAAAGYALREGGRACAIYPSARMVEIVSQMRSRRIEPKRLRMVHSRPGARGVFVLAEGVKGGREELAVEPPLYIYGEAGGYSPEMAAVFRCLSVSPADGDGRSPAS